MENIYSKMAKIFSFDRLGQYLNSAGIFLITLLWSYAVFAKLSDLELYQRQMNEQPFSPGMISYVLVLVPVLELASATLLILKRYISGLWISLALLFCFTVYIALILNKVFPSTPCSCGGFISNLSWKNHLYFNLFLIALNTFCLIQTNKKRKEVNGKEKSD